MAELQSFCEGHLPQVLAQATFLEAALDMATMNSAQGTSCVQAWPCKRDPCKRIIMCRCLLGMHKGRCTRAAGMQQKCITVASVPPQRTAGGPCRVQPLMYWRKADRCNQTPLL